MEAGSLIPIGRGAAIRGLLWRVAARSVALDSELLSQVGSIIDDVRRRGDEAVIDYTRRFDGVELATLRVTGDALRESAARVDHEVVAALRLAIANVRNFHEPQREESAEIAPS